MPNQGSVTVLTKIHPGKLADLKAMLSEIERKVSQDGSIFERINKDLAHIHFARWLILEQKEDLDGNTLEPQLVYLCNFDILERHWGEKHFQYLVKHRIENFDGQHMDILDELYGCCDDYPVAPSENERVEYLKRNTIGAQTFYVNKIGRTVQQARKEAELRDAIEQYLDSRTWDGMAAKDVRAKIQEFVSGRNDLNWAMDPQSPIFPVLSDFLEQITDRIKQIITTGIDRIIDGLEVLGRVPLIPLDPRISSGEDLVREGKADIDPLPPKTIEELEQFDYHGAVQSPFSAVGLVRPGLIRNLAVNLILTATDYGAHYLFSNSNLAGIKTIHFARWIFIDGERRVLFCSNYDGSLENYMSDFIDKAAWGLNLVFGNGIGYPETVLGVLKGAEHEVNFRRFLRNRQIPAPTYVWYTAYPTLTALNLRTNTEIREDLVDKPSGLLGVFREEMSETEAQVWLRKL